MSDRQMGERDRKTRGAARQTVLGQVERFCARCNDGLAVVAAVLAVIVLLTAVIRVPNLLAEGLAAQAEAESSQGADPVY
jgi:hypothetical protein